MNSNHFTCNSNVELMIKNGNNVNIKVAGFSDNNMPTISIMQDNKHVNIY